MGPDRWRQIEDLYHRALELPPEARRAFLAENCRGDESLQRRLELLLEQDASAGKLLDKPAAELLSDLVGAGSFTSLPAGAELGPYRIEGVLGQGGMGHVYKAHDSRLGRSVAIKVSMDRFNTRFEQEARAVAALNHPHICTLYDVGPDYLVMELVEGETLADRIAKGKLPLEEALRIAAQIAEALEYSHEQGVIHRDVKPANVKITPTGSVKVLDFGLAKLAAEVRAKTSHGSTLTMRETKSGVIMGTAAYMAPEQARGQTIDKRADIWAFGVVLYEMLTGERPFRGDTFADTLTAVVGSEADWTRVPPKAQLLVRACLEKNARERLRDIGDFKRLLAEAPQPVATPASKRLWWKGAAIAVTAGLLGWAIAGRLGRKSMPDFPLVRFAVAPPENVSYRPGSISPDGRWFAFIGVDASGKSQLWVRRMDSGVARPLFPAENYPFWSPDSRFIAFKQNDKLMKVEPPGGTPQTICETPLVVGGSWSRQGVILFGKGDVLMQASAAGGELKQLSRLNTDRKEIAHDFPVLLPDGRHFLYTIHSEKRQFGGLFVGSLDSPEARIRLLDEITNAEYVTEPADPSGGYLLFARGDALMAQRFDARNFQLQGDAWSVLENVPRNPSNLSLSLSVSSNGLLAVSPSYVGEQLTWFDRTGKRLGTIGKPGLHLFPELSPDERTLADDPTDPETFAPSIWLLPLAGGPAARFTFIASDHPVWSPDGSRIAFGAMTSALYIKTSAGSENEELVLKAAKITNQIAGDDYRMPCNWSRDGKFLIYMERGAKDLFSLWTLPLSGDRRPRLLLQNEFNNRCGALSPDGRWIAYSSDEQGRSEIYVQAFRETGTLSGRKWQVSYNGGTWPKWRRDGKELFFLDGGRNMVALEVKNGSTFEHGPPQTLFATGIMTNDSRYDVTADGSRFIIPADVSNGSTPATVVVNWLRKGGR